jgi:Rrf2 family protein
MVAMANQPFGTYVPAPRIGEEMLIPQPFMAKVIGDLKRSGLVMTVAGRSGGLALTRPAAAITLRHIVEAVEGPIMLNTCLIRAGECPRDRTCPAHLTWQHIQRVLYRELEAVNLASLAEQTYPLSSAGDKETEDVPGGPNG